MSKQIIKGDELQIFLGNNAPKYATSHALTLTGNTLDIATKDHGFWGASEVGKLSWELTAECLYTDGDYDSMFDKMIMREKFNIRFTKVKNYDVNGLVAVGGNVAAWRPDLETGLQGYATITSMTANANTGENATYSITFTGAGPLSSILPKTDYIEFTMDFDTSSPILFEVANYDSNLVIYNKTTGDVIPTSHEEGLYEYTGDTDLTNVNVRIAMDGTQFISMYSTISGPLVINMNRVPTFLWLDTTVHDVDTVVFGPDVTAVTASAFANRPNSGTLETRLNYNSKPMTPPTLEQDALGNVAEVRTIIVPEGTLSVYQHEWSAYSSADWDEE